MARASAVFMSRPQPMAQTMHVAGSTFSALRGFRGLAGLTRADIAFLACL